ncbi:MAG: hypothetical protein AABP62_00335 [Planctomycetota bacterium]
MANDPGLSNDTCIFMEAISGDGGNQDPNSVWWLSPDINLVGPVSGPENADAGQINPVRVKFHRKSANSNCLFPGDESVSVELWVANPSLVMSPRVPGSATRVGFIGSPLPSEGSVHTQQIDWNLPAGLPPGDPQSPGHKCLIARCYPDSGTPAGTGFFVPGDQHVAQHNLAIVTSASRSIKFKANTVNPSVLARLPSVGQVKLRAVLDLNPIKFVSRTLAKRLHGLAGFTQLRTTPLPKGFKFDLTGLQPSQIVDHSHPDPQLPFPHKGNPSFEAQIALASRKVTPLTFLANLTGAKTGEACVFHLSQTSVKGSAEGGLTLVVVKL